MSSVLFISLMGGSPWGGSEALWYSAALEAAGKGHKVGVVVYHWPQKEARVQTLAEAGCSIFYLPNRGRSKRTIADRIQNKITKWFRIGKALEALPVEDYELVVVNQGYFETTSGVWKNFHRRLKNYVLLFHNYSEKERISPAKAEILKAWISRASHNLFASDRTRIILEDRLKIQIGNADVLINPISFTPPDDVTPFPPLYNDHYRMVVLAALDVKRKAQDQLIIALSSKRWKGENWTLHIYGSGRDARKLKRLIKKQGLEEKVFLEGHAENVQQILRDAHILLHASHIDAMPLAVVEALAMSRPVMASRVGDMPEWVIFNSNGWICHHAGAEEIDRMMHLVWAGRHRWHELGMESYRIFREKYHASPEAYFFNQIGI